MPDDFLKKENIGVINLHYYLNDVEYGADGFDAKDFYNRLRNGDKGATSQPNSYEFETFFRSALDGGKDILHLSFSSVLSGTYSNAVSVAKKLLPLYPDRKIIIIDTKSQSAGQGLLVDLVARFRDKGHTFDECAAEAERLIQHVNHIFTIDDLRCLASSGRVGNAEAFIGTILQIKPLLYTNAEGKLTPYYRLISRKMSLNGLADKVKAKYNGAEKTIYITHSDCRKDAEYVADRISQQIPDAKITLFDLNPVIGCHTGANTIAVFFIADNRNIR
jgi:DegV family protein with EDD domain